MAIDPIPTVLWPAVSTDLVSIDTLKLELQLTNTDDDDWLTLAIGEISGLIQDYVKRPFAVETVRDLFYLRQEPRRYAFRMPSGVSKLQLSRWPAKWIAWVEVVSSSDETETLSEGVDFVVDYGRAQLTRLDTETGEAVPWRGQKLTVDYEGGFDATPPAIAQVTLKLLTQRYFGRKRDPLLLEKSSPTQGTQRWWVGGAKSGGMFFPEDEGVLNLYREPTAT